MRELISGILEKQDKIIMENKELRKKYSECESALKINNEMKGNRGAKERKCDTYD